MCISTLGQRTEVIRELAALRKRFDFDIDLYDQTRMSEMLRERGDLVRRLFGQEWERLFCTGEPVAPPPRSSADVLVDAILRGPLEALGLATVASRADHIAHTDPSQAAQLYDQVASALEGGEFGGFAERFRQRQIEALIGEGKVDEAVRLLAEAAWRDAESAYRFRVREASSKLKGLAEGGTPHPSAAHVANVLDVVDRWYADPFLDLQEAANDVSELAHRGAPGATSAALWLVESAIVDGQDAVVRTLRATLEALASEREARTESDELAVRLRLSIADATGEWDAIVDRALRGQLGRRPATLVHARHGRYLAWNTDPEAADKSYRLAIDQACQVNLNSEAAAALGAIWTVGVRYGLPDENWSGALELARAVRPLGGDFCRRALTDERLESAN